MSGASHLPSKEESPVVFNLRQIAASNIARWDIRNHIAAAADEIERLTRELAAERALRIEADPPHCPTCGCGAPETERPIREDIKVGSTLFRAGVKLRIVLERIERGFTYHAEPSEKASGEPTSGSGCPACGVMYVAGARHFSGCPLHPGEAV